MIFEKVILVVCLYSNNSDHVIIMVIDDNLRTEITVDETLKDINELKEIGRVMKKIGGGVKYT